jgi:hypothetical protein
VTIEYSLTRTEIVRGFFRSLRSSPKYRLTILLNAVAIAVLVLLLRIASSRKITVQDVLIAIAWAIGFLVFMPLWLFIRGKTAKRTLTISPDGIYTEIGKIRARVPWRKIHLVIPAEQYILIARPGGNSFFVPIRAFSGLEQRDQFLGEISRWMKSTG